MRRLLTGAPSGSEPVGWAPGRPAGAGYGAFRSLLERLRRSAQEGLSPAFASPNGAALLAATHCSRSCATRNRLDRDRHVAVPGAA